MNQQDFTNNQTALNNEMTRYGQQAAMTGTVPGALIAKDNPYFNQGGSLINKDIDYQAIIDNASAQLQGATDPTVRAQLQKTINDANAARNYKITNFPEYGQYAQTMRSNAPNATADMQQFQGQLGYDYAGLNEQGRQANMNDLLQRYITEAQGNVQLAQARLNYDLGMAGYGSQERMNTANNQVSMTKIAQDAQTARMNARLAAQSGTGAGDTTTAANKPADEKPRLTLDQANTALNRNQVTPEAIYTWEYYNKDKISTYADRGMTALKNRDTGATSQELAVYLNQFAGYMTDAELGKLMDKYGLK